MDLNKVNYWINSLELEPHKEGGYYKQSFKSTEELTDRSRVLYTSIYFLLRSGEVSHFHRLQSDELWYFHAGDTLSIHMIHENGNYEEARLGLNIEKGEVPQILVPKNTIFGSTVSDNGAFALVGCMVSPGFEFQDFELFTKMDLLQNFPQHKEVIQKLAYEKLPS